MSESPARATAASGPEASTPRDRVQLELMRLLDTKHQVSQREVASALGMSLGKANYCLRALITRGFVKVENYRNSRNKLAYFYLLTPSGLAHKADLTRRFLARRMREYDELRAEIEQLQHESGVTPAALRAPAPRDSRDSRTETEVS